MKKLIALAALVAALPAFSAEVTSDNIVGYKKIALPANKMAILANCFVPDNGSIQDMVAGGDVSLEGVDSIRLWNPMTRVYTLVNWWGDGYGVYADAEADEPCADYGWGDGNQTIVEYPLDVGQGFWGQAEAGGYIQMSGNVATSGTIDIPANKITLVGNPYPVDTDIQTIVAGGDFSLEGVDSIRVYDPLTRTYTLANWWGEGYGVYADAEADEPCAEMGWGDGNQTIINMTVPAGYGFWCQSEGGGTLTFKDPLAK